MKREAPLTKSMLAKIGMSEAQLKLKQKHGTPVEFSQAVYAAVPEYLSMAEAADATDKYLKEWISAA